MKKQMKRLVLERETLRMLTQRELNEGQVRGATSVPSACYMDCGGTAWSVCAPKPVLRG